MNFDNYRQRLILYSKFCLNIIEAKRLSKGYIEANFRSFYYFIISLWHFLLIHCVSVLHLQLPGRQPCPAAIWPDRSGSTHSCSREQPDADPCRNRTPPTDCGGNCGCSTVGHCGRRSKAPQKEPVERFPIAHVATSGAQAPHPLDVARLCLPMCRSTV